MPGLETDYNIRARCLLKLLVTEDARHQVHRRRLSTSSGFHPVALNPSIGRRSNKMASLLDDAMRISSARRSTSTTHPPCRSVASRAGLISRTPSP